jgi:acyl-CoA thioesterase II
MGDLAEDTAVEAVGDGMYTAKLNADWEIWGPMGGYVAAVALRAAGAASSQPFPAAFSCHYLSVARFAPVDIRVQSRKKGRTAEAQRVEITQDERPVLDAMVWSTGEVEGLEHDVTVAPEVAGPDALTSMAELMAEAGERPAVPFMGNFDVRPLTFERPWPPDGPREPVHQQWMRYLPTSTFDDPWVDAARSVILVDLPSWPSVHRMHAWRQPPYTAPTLDLNVAFHHPSTREPWLLCDGAAPLSANGLFGWNARVWSPGGTLHASGGGQCLYRRLPS